MDRPNDDPAARIQELETRLRHLVNELRLTKEEHEDALSKYLDIHFHLERKITERTRELLASNQQLLAEMEERKKAETDREKLLIELQQAMEKVKVLSGFLPICSSCKKVRDEQGQWRQVEEFISSYSDTKFSHGMCPVCTEKIYPEIHRKMHLKNKE